MVKHIVLFSYEKELDSPEIMELHQRFCALPGIIPEISGFESGMDISVEGISRGYTMSYVLSFKGCEERDRYLVHPSHKEFSEFAGPFLKDVLVFDYDAEVILT
ncbi:Dabb family protein [Oceanispirochaeta sp.]|jgi:hypothetical protein|uniref:Dabb family protein n=1 Tax=Oceanispirochaeta sp. TaxID=2035350 RepID=UPI00262DF047|nr:Dabb family protein [Oceanispirochaeta sp.]MDA3958601.1 Dabb family protein [Oceanispirochaeta sp.]